MDSVENSFGHLTAPWVQRTNAHNLLNILTIAMGAILCGAEGPTRLETVGNATIECLRTMMPVPNGISSHDVVH